MQFRSETIAKPEATQIKSGEVKDPFSSAFEDLGNLPAYRFVRWDLRFCKLRGFLLENDAFGQNFGPV